MGGVKRTHDYIPAIALAAMAARRFIGRCRPRGTRRIGRIRVGRGFVNPSRRDGLLLVLNILRGKTIF